MNIWIHGLRVPAWQELTNALTFNEPLDRSAAAIYYRPIYNTFHLNFLPYLLVHDGLVIATKAVIYCLLALLFPPRLALLGIAPILSIPMFMDIYLATNTIYDVLATLASWAACALLLQSESKSNRFLWLPAILCYQFALASKEIAILPPCFLLLTALFTRRHQLLGITSLLIPQTLWCLFRKLGPVSGMQSNPGYALSTEASRIASNAIWYVRWATDFQWNEPTPMAIAIVGLLLTLTLGFMVKAEGRAALIILILGFGFYLLLYPRNLFVVFCMSPCVAILIAALADRLPIKRLCLPIALSIATLGVIWTLTRSTRYASPIVTASQPARRSIAALNQMHLTVPTGAAFLVEQDPFPLDDFAVQILLALQYRDPTISAVRLKFHHKPPASPTIRIRLD